MRLWWIKDDRSCRRAARQQLSQARTVRGGQWLLERARRKTRDADLRLVASVAVLTHAPLLFYVDTKPGDWLDTAWQISGVLLGLVITLTIFLLQAVSGQRFRSEATFRAVVRRTYVLWPVVFAVAFICVTAVALRFSGGDAPPSGWIETYAVALFVAQVLLFGLCLLEALAVVSPQAVSRTLVQHFRDAVFVAVEQDLADRLAGYLAYEACTASDVSYGGFLARGWAVPAARGGWVKDVDRDLPRRLADFRVAEYVTITAQPGDLTNESSPLARSDIPVRGWLVREVRAGVRLTRKRPPTVPLDVFEDAVDVARRSLDEASELSHDLAVELLAGCTTALHDAYMLYGIDY